MGQRSLRLLGTKQITTDMKKIMFSEHCHMQTQVLRGKKTMTRRLANGLPARYRKGEVVAIARTYEDIGLWDMWQTAGWYNKMFVRPDLMPDHITVIDVKGEYLQDISVEDCYREGVPRDIEDPRAFFAELIDRINGKGTWNRNPMVYAYAFELTKKN